MSRARWVAKEIGPALAGIAVLVVIWAVVAALVDSSSLPPGCTRSWTGCEPARWSGVKTLIQLAFSFAVAIAIGTAIGFGLAITSSPAGASGVVLRCRSRQDRVAAPRRRWFVLRRGVVVAIVGRIPSRSTMAAFRQVGRAAARA
jgi:hypothetical protein